MENKIERLTVEAVELLKEMISIPSPSFEEDAVCSHVCKWISDHGVEHRRVGNNIIAEHIADPTRPTLMLCAHMDTVSPSPEYSFDPYKPENCPEDMVQGLGSNDDGASVVAMIAAYRYFTCHDGIGSGFQNRATPLVAGTSELFRNSPVDCFNELAHDEGVGGVVLRTTANAPTFSEISVSCNHGDD